MPEVLTRPQVSCDTLGIIRSRKGLVMAAHSTPSTDPSPIFPAPQRSRESANIPRPFTRDRLPNLLQALATHDVLKDALRSAFPDVDDQTLRDTLEGIRAL